MSRRGFLNLFTFDKGKNERKFEGNDKWSSQSFILSSHELQSSTNTRNRDHSIHYFLVGFPVKFWILLTDDKNNDFKIPLK